jgi:hypothetical protein
VTGAINPISSKPPRLQEINVPSEPPVSDAFYAALAAAREDDDTALVFARTYAEELRPTFDAILASLLRVMRKGMKQDGMGPMAIRSQCSHFRKTALSEWQRIRSTSSGNLGRA